MDDFKNSVLSGDFSKAYEISKSMRKGEILGELLDISFNSQNMLAYGFVIFVLLKEETGTYHRMASMLLTSAYVALDSACELAFCHAKRALEVDPDSFDTLTNIMGLASHPDTSGTEEDYIKAKKRIAELFPGDPILKQGYTSGIAPEDAAKSRISEWHIK